MNALVIGRCPKTAEQLKTFCDQVIIVLDESFARERSLPELNEYIVEYCKSNISSVKGIIPRANEILCLIKKYNINIVFSNTKWDMVAAKLASKFYSKKIFLFATNHNSYSWQNKFNILLMSILIKLTTDCYVALASFVYNKLKLMGHKVHKLILVPNTVGYETWMVKNDYKYNNQFRIAYVAYVCPEKRQDLIVDVLNMLNEKYNVVFDCYGDLDEHIEYVDYINKKISCMHLEGRLNLKGKIENEELRTILKDYDAYFSPSKMEMSPVNILEAQAVGLPVIAAKVGGIPDLIIDGKTGLLFEVDDVKSIVQKIEMVINSKDLRENLGSSGRYYVSNVYTKFQAGERLKSVIFMK